MKKRKFFRLALLALSCLGAGNAWAWNEPKQDENGVWQLGSVNDVEWFAEHVEAGNTTAKAVLTADIDYEGHTHTPIGQNDKKKYQGVFDGKSHKITNLVIDDSSKSCIGFFGWVRGGATIKNLIIDESCSFTGKECVGALVGTVKNGETYLLIENCVNRATVKATNTGSGFIGSGKSPYINIRLENCLNAGKITAGKSSAFCSWINKGGSSLTNCVNIGEIVGMDNSGDKFTYNCNLVRYEPGTLTLTNCYDLSKTEGCGQGVGIEWLTDNPLTSGELCYLLNGDQTDISWYQRIDTDAYPMPFAADGGRVYANGTLNCDGTPIGDVTYSNKQETEIPPHDYQDGFCKHCVAFDSNYAPLVDGAHQISDASQLYWFSRMVNEYGGSNWNAKLMSDIDMKDYNNRFSPIGTNSSRYAGHFDGQGHSISNLIIDVTGNFVGFIGYVGVGAVIENMILDETCSIKGTGECVAFVGGANQVSGDVTMRNLGNKGKVIAGGKQAAGIFGGNAGSKAKIYIENCFSMGNIQGSSECAAIAGWAGSNGPVVNNCWSCSEVLGNDNSDLYLVRHGKGTLTNIFSTKGNQGVIISSDQIKNGSLCYLLNGDQSKITWTQTIGSEELPNVFGNTDRVNYVGPAGYATLCCTTDFAINGDVKASIITGAEGTKLVQKYVTNVPAEEGVLLEGTYYNIIGTTESTDDCTGNKLVGVTEDMPAPVGTYVLQDNDGKVGFYLVAEDQQPTIKGGKAYLALTGNEAKALFLDGDGATGITEMAEMATDGDAEIYNLAGQRVNKATKGIYIIGGKKVLK